MRFRQKAKFAKKAKIANRASNGRDKSSVKYDPMLLRYFLSLEWRACVILTP